MNATTDDVRQHILRTARVIIGGKGFSAVGLNEILAASGVPKGSFYHYFGSKEAFGKALLEDYFTGYLEALDALLSRRDLSAAERLMTYFTAWLETQASSDPKGKCLAVKLAAEVSDLSEAMRMVLVQGTDQIIGRLAGAIEDGMADNSLPVHLDPNAMATMLYQLWLGSNVRAKITHDRAPMEAALVATRSLLELRCQSQH